MKIKDQIRAVRERRGVSIVDLAARLGVSDQAVRYWESGRSYPGKPMAAKIEQALDFSLDWSEGAKHSGSRLAANALLDQQDIDLLLLICRLPYGLKTALADLVRAALEAADGGGRQIIQGKEETQPVPPFSERSREQVHAGKGAKGKAVGRRAPTR